MDSEAQSYMLPEAGGRRGGVDGGCGAQSWTAVVNAAADCGEAADGPGYPYVVLGR